MKLKDKIKELEDQKKKLMTDIFNGEDNIVGFVENMGNIKFALKQLKDIDVEEVDDDSVFDVDRVFETIKDMSGGAMVYKIQNLLIEIIKQINDKHLTSKIITNGRLGSVLMDIVGYTLIPVKPVNSEYAGYGGKDTPYTIGQISDILIFVDPYMKWNDNRIIFFKDDNEVFTLNVKDDKYILI